MCMLDVLTSRPKARPSDDDDDDDGDDDGGMRCGQNVCSRRIAKATEWSPHPYAIRRGAGTVPLTADTHID